MPSIVSKVEHLIALATDAGATEAEARTAAMVACQAIREHKLVITERGRAPPPPPRHEPPRRENRPPEPRRGPPPGPRPPPGRKRIRSQFDSICAYCCEPYYAGDTVFWSRGAGAFHPWCHDAAERGSPPPQQAHPPPPPPPGWSYGPPPPHNYEPPPPRPPPRQEAPGMSAEDWEEFERGLRNE